MTAEIWIAVEGWPYEASSLGRIRRATAASGTSAGRVLRPVLKAGGYLGVTLSFRGRQKQALIHDLVCRAFRGPPPPGHEVRHLDGNRRHNAETNLCWGSSAENANDKRAHGTLLNGDRHPRTKVKEADYVTILRAWDEWPRGYGKTAEFIAVVTRRYGVSKGFVEDAIYGRVRATRVRAEALA